jgi:hypothetical protein
MEKPAKALRYLPSKASGEQTVDLYTKVPVVPRFPQTGLDFGEQKFLPTTQADLIWAHSPFNERLLADQHNLTLANTQYPINNL